MVKSSKKKKGTEVGDCKPNIFTLTFDFQFLTLSSNGLWVNQDLKKEIVKSFGNILNWLIVEPSGELCVWILVVCVVNINWR